MAKATRNSKPRRLRRPLLDEMLHELTGRLRKLCEEAEAFETIIQPNGQHTVAEHQTRTACGVLLNSLQRRIRDAEGFARLLVRDQVSA